MSESILDLSYCVMEDLDFDMHLNSLPHFGPAMADYFATKVETKAWTDNRAASTEDGFESDCSSIFGSHSDKEDFAFAEDDTCMPRFSAVMTDYLNVRWRGSCMESSLGKSCSDDGRVPLRRCQ